MKTLYGDRSKSVAEERRNASRLLTEVENLSLRLFYMESAKNDVRGDIAVMKRAAEKTENAAARTELDKQKQVIREYGSTVVREYVVRGTGVGRTWYGRVSENKCFSQCQRIVYSNSITYSKLPVF